MCLRVCKFHRKCHPPTRRKLENVAWTHEEESLQESLEEAEFLSSDLPIVGFDTVFQLRELCVEKFISRVRMPFQAVEVTR